MTKLFFVHDLSMNNDWSMNFIQNLDEKATITSGNIAGKRETRAPSLSQT